MAVATRLAQFTAVIVVFFVTADAISRRIPVLFVRQMAVGTLHIVVREEQGEVRQVMIEVVFYEFNDIRAPPLVIGVTCGTFGATDIAG